MNRKLPICKYLDTVGAYVYDEVHDREFIIYIAMHGLTEKLIVDINDLYVSLDGEITWTPYRQYVARPTDKELRNKAYHIATGNHLTESFNYEDFQNTDISDYTWEMVEDWPIQQLEVHISGLAEEIYIALKG